MRSGCEECGKRLSNYAKPYWVIQPYPPYRIAGRVHTGCRRTTMLVVRDTYDPMAARFHAYMAQQPLGDGPKWWARLLLDRQYDRMDFTEGQQRQFEYWRQGPAQMEDQMVEAVKDAYWDLHGAFEEIVA